MSLDVYLQSEGELHECACRDCGTVHTTTKKTEYFSANITHNLNVMAGEAGIYEALWRPEEIGAVKAGDIVTKLEAGLELLKSDPDRFKAFTPSNNWGSYDGLVSFTETYLEACKVYPNAVIHVSR